MFQIRETCLCTSSTSGVLQILVKKHAVADRVAVIFPASSPTAVYTKVAVGSLVVTLHMLLLSLLCNFTCRPHSYLSYTISTNADTRSPSFAPNLDITSRSMPILSPNFYLTASQFVQLSLAYRHLSELEPHKLGRAILGQSVVQQRCGPGSDLVSYLASSASHPRYAITPNTSIHLHGRRCCRSKKQA